VPKLFEFLRKQLGDEVELLHDVHERIPPVLAYQLGKDLEPYKLFFLKDPLSPEDVGYFANLRQQTSTPLAMGELFNNPNEWLPLVSGRLIDFIRIHLSQVGGLTPAKKIASLCEFFGVRKFLFYTVAAAFPIALRRRNPLGRYSGSTSNGSSVVEWFTGRPAPRSGHGRAGHRPSGGPGCGSCGREWVSLRPAWSAGRKGVGSWRISWRRQLLAFVRFRNYDSANPPRRPTSFQGVSPCTAVNG
jgi:mannonate dehydratase